MSGSRVTGTLWSVVWRHRPLEEKPGAEPFTTGHNHIVTADPSGREVFETAKGIVLGANKDRDLGFMLAKVERCCEIEGTAVVAQQARAN